MIDAIWIDLPALAAAMVPVLATAGIDVIAEDVALEVERFVEAVRCNAAVRGDDEDWAHDLAEAAVGEPRDDVAHLRAYSDQLHKDREALIYH